MRKPYPSWRLRFKKSDCSSLSSFVTTDEHFSPEKDVLVLYSNSILKALTDTYDTMEEPFSLLQFLLSLRASFQKLSSSKPNSRKIFAVVILPGKKGFDPLLSFINFVLARQQIEESCKPSRQRRARSRAKQLKVKRSRRSATPSSLPSSSTTPSSRPLEMKRKQGRY